MLQKGQEFENIYLLRTEKKFNLLTFIFLTYAFKKCKIYLYFGNSYVPNKDISVNKLSTYVIPWDHG